MITIRVKKRLADINIAENFRIFGQSFYIFEILCHIIEYYNMEVEPITVLLYNIFIIAKFFIHFILFSYVTVMQKKTYLQIIEDLVLCQDVYAKSHVESLLQIQKKTEIIMGFYLLP